MLAYPRRFLNDEADDKIVPFYSSVSLSGVFLYLSLLCGMIKKNDELFSLTDKNIHTKFFAHIYVLNILTNHREDKKTNRHKVQIHNVNSKFSV